MLTRTQALEGGANVTCISKVQFTYHSFIRLTILGHYADGKAPPHCMLQVSTPCERAF